MQCTMKGVCLRWFCVFGRLLVCNGAELLDFRNGVEALPSGPLLASDIEDTGEQVSPMVNSSVDPLVDFLRSLKLRLPSISKEKAGVVFNVSDLTCTGLSITRIASNLHADTSAPFIAATLHGLGVECAGNFAYHGLAVIAGSGGLHAKVNAADNSMAYGRLNFPVQASNVPDRAEFSGCGANLDFEITFSRSILSWILDAFVALLKSSIKDTVVKQVCAQVTDFVATNLTAAIRDLNKMILPPAVPQSSGEFWTASDANSAPEGILDWRRVAALDWGNWLFGDLIGAKGVDAAIRWALKNSTTAKIPGPLEPVLSKVIQQDDTGLQLNITVKLVEIDVVGGESIQRILPLQAASSTDLQVGVDFGTAELPAVDVATRLAVQIKALDPTKQLPPTVVHELLDLKLGLQKPSVGMQMRVMVSEEQLQKSRVAAQWYFAPSLCARSLLTEAPSLQKLNISFADLSAPLSFGAATSGQLEADLATLLNENIRLFNVFYQRYLPSAITRLAASGKFLATANEILSQQLGPAQCIDAAAARKKAATLPKYFQDWPALFSGTARGVVDKIVDGLLEHNTTSMNRGFADMPVIGIQPGTAGPVTIEDAIAVNLTAGALSGLNQVSRLRMLVPSDSDPRVLTTRMEVQCPVPAAPWQPAVALVGSLKAQSAGRGDEGTLRVTAPCGQLQASTAAVVDVHQLMDLPFPPDVRCTLRAFSQLQFKEIQHHSNSSGSLVVEPSTGPAQWVDREFCEKFPEACTVVSRIVSGLVTTDTANGYIDSLRSHSDSRCVVEELASTMAAESDGLNEHSTSVIVVGVLASFVFVMGASAAVRKGRSLAAECWLRESWRAVLCVSSIALLLSATLWLRIVSIFVLPVASVDAAVHVASFGGEVANIHLITFYFFNLVEHFWQSGAYVCSIALVAAPFLDGFLVVIVLIMLWLTPVLEKYRRLLLRLLLVVARFPFIDVVFFSLALPVLNHDIELPLGVELKLRNRLQGGVHSGMVSTALSIVACLSLQAVSRPPTAADEVPAPSVSATRRKRAASAVGGAGLLLGLSTWLMCNFLHSEITEVAGALIPASSFTLGDVLMQSWSGDPILFFAFASTSVLAPLLQAIAAVCTAVRPESSSADGAGSSARVVAFIRGLGDAFADMDVYALGFFIAFVPEVSGFAKWIVRDQFGVVCDIFERGAGLDCIGVNATVMWLGASGLLLATACSTGLLAWHAVTAAATLRRAIETRQAFFTCDSGSLSPPARGDTFATCRS